MCASRNQSALVTAIPHVCGSIPAVKPIKSASCGPEGSDCIFPSAFMTARVAQALLTVCCAKKPGKSVSYCPTTLFGSPVEEGSHLKRNIRAWRGFNADSASGSSEYKSSTMYGTPSVFRSSLKIGKGLQFGKSKRIRLSTYVKTPGSDSVSCQPLESSSDMMVGCKDAKWMRRLDAS